MAVDLKCVDVLKDNDYLYARKARRKKIAIVRIEATNRDSSSVELHLGAATLTAGGKNFEVEPPAVVIRKLGEFTWDFLLYSILDFHPLTAVIDGLLFLTGPLYNRRLRRQLALLSEGEMLLSPGESKSAWLAFRGVSAAPERVTISLRRGEGREEQRECGIGSA